MTRIFKNWSSLDGIEICFNYGFGGLLKDFFKGIFILEREGHRGAEGEGEEET